MIKYNNILLSITGVSADSVRPDTYDRKQQFNRILLTAVVFEIKSFKSSVHPSDDAGVGGLHSLWFINLTPFCMKRVHNNITFDIIISSHNAILRRYKVHYRLSIGT